MSVMLISTAFQSTGFAKKKYDDPVPTDGSIVTIREGQNIQLNVEATKKYDVITVDNPSDLFGDVDVVAIDEAGNVIDQGSVEVNPNVKTVISLLEVFSNSKISDIDSIQVQISLRRRPIFAVNDLANPIAFFSQVDPSWKGEKMGKSGLTVGGFGCAMTSVAMAGAYKMRNLTPER
jgi:hypothetical protein